MSLKQPESRCKNIYHGAERKGKSIERKIMPKKKEINKHWHKTKNALSEGLVKVIELIKLINNT